jgi:hypothetical protein
MHATPHRLEDAAGSGNAPSVAVAYPRKTGFGRPEPVTLLGLSIALVAFALFWLCNRTFDAGRGDLFYLADALLHGRVWIDAALGANDVIYMNGHVYVPFAPFPAVVMMPLVAIVGPVTADQWESGINAGLAAAVVGLAWWASGRIGVKRVEDRGMLAILLGFSTQIWWVTTRGGVWHTGHLVATVLLLLLIGELFGRRRPVLLGLLVGAAFLTRPPTAFAAPAVALWLMDSGRVRAAGISVADRLDRLPWRGWVLLAAGVAPALVGFFAYNYARFGSPLESGYALATLPDWLQALRNEGLFSLAHVRMNVDYLFLKIPELTPQFPWFRPDGLGMSVFITSPGLLLAARAPWRDRRSWLLLLAAVLVLIPTLLYYGGGWLQYGYRYFLDSIPFVWALVAIGVVNRGPLRWWARLLIWFGVLIGLGGVYWAYHL